MIYKNHNRFLLLLACCILGGLPGCVVAPVQEMSDARQAILAAARNGGEQRAPEQMQAARSALGQAEQALRNNQYKQARRHAEQARELAIAIQQLSTGS